MVTVAHYLGVRLRQLGAPHLFGVPGDFNLNLLDGLAEVDGLQWHGSPNELGAAYAADAYARSRGLAALFTTYGVGELSALNGVAGSAAEDVPVLHVVGSPRTATVAAGALVHHTLADGDFGHFARAYAEVTVAQETVTAERAGEQIDAVILAAITHRRPAYLSIPQDLALLDIPADALAQPLVAASDPAALAAFTAAARELLSSAARPVAIAGHLIPRFGLAEPVTRMLTTAALPTVTQISAKAVIDSPIHFGDYAGTMLAESPTALVDAADTVLHLGTTLTAELTGFFTHRPPDDRTLWTTPTTAKIGPASFPGVLFPDTIAALAEVLAEHSSSWAEANEPPHTAAPTMPTAQPTATAEQQSTAVSDPAAGQATDASRVAAGGSAESTTVDQDGPLTQAELWPALQDWLPPHSALIADTGTASWGALGMRLPADTVFLGQPIWNSIGWALPAVLGQGLADPTRRPVLIIGDGAAQMTIQELGTIDRAAIHPLVLLLNNRGYTIERALQSPRAVYNDIPNWNWRAVVAGLTGPDTDFHTATTRTELIKALATASTDRLVFIEVLLDTDDVPPLLTRLAERATTAARSTA